MRKCPKFVLSLSEVAEVCPKMTFDIPPVALPTHASKQGDLFRKVKLKTYRKANLMPQKLR